MSSDDPRDDPSGDSSGDQEPDKPHGILGQCCLESVCLYIKMRTTWLTRRKNKNTVSSSLMAP